MHQLPLGSRVVFVDWHGVLSRDPFWVSIREGARHPLKAQLEAQMAEKVFSRETDTANEWMKGLLSAEQIIAAMDIRLPKNFRDDFLSRKLYVDCAQMKVNVKLFEALRTMKSVAMFVLATDNMDCFVRTFDRVRSRGRRPRQEPETLADWAMICDDIICSSDVGVLKAEDPVGFFGKWLVERGLGFSDAALIDDRADNCDAFASQGGTPVQYKMASGDVNDVVTTLVRWIEGPR